MGSHRDVIRRNVHFAHKTEYIARVSANVGHDPCPLSPASLRPECEPGQDRVSSDQTTANVLALTFDIAADTEG